MAKHLHVKRYLVKPGSSVRLAKMDPDDTSGFDGDKNDGEKAIDAVVGKLDPLQDLLYAEHKHRILIVLQGMDASGKDGTIRRVFEGVNPEGVRVAHFGRPSAEELDRDYLWRVHKQVPGKGEVVIFNRSHYESVLVERVHGLVPESVWSRRYQQIVDFEKMLNEEGTTILKFFLHIDKKEQAKRFQDRLKDPTKHWKFSYLDYNERAYWKDYARAYEDALERTSMPSAPWYVVPSNHSWFRDLVVSEVVVEALDALKMRYPKLDPAKAAFAADEASP
ncbi:MAG TPA: polyphosphate kinase 2 family protein [Nitrososphaerales archaeon]|nr:polyphosphate kinase 2 family protein [Nitrososphaerales archaeon]